jgi:hypothetical protein
LRDQYRKYLKKLTTKSGQSASIKIPKWKYADEMSFVHLYLRERDTFTNPEFDKKGETDEEEFYKQRVNMMEQRNKRSRLQPVQKISSKIRFSEGQNTIGINLRQHPQY